MVVILMFVIVTIVVAVARDQVGLATGAVAVAVAGTLVPVSRHSTLASAHAGRLWPQAVSPSVYYDGR